MEFTYTESYEGPQEDACLLFKGAVGDFLIQDNVQRHILKTGYMGPTNFTVLVEMMTKGYNIIRDVTKTIIGAIRTVKVLRAATKLAKEEDTESEEAGAF
ncbi:hypothetical protein FQN55_002159 [Onygenales sp. PD_40]|nr:hypothetical protein FQN55_002159 [Onygenales sp. PD_40]